MLDKEDKFERFDKEDWIIQYIKTNNNVGVDMLNTQFVDDYVEKFDPKYKVMLWGANKCDELSKLLSSMYNQGILRRVPIGIPNSPAGMPKWVYVYTLTKLGERM